MTCSLVRCAESAQLCDGAAAKRPLAPAAPAHLQPFLAIETAELLVVHGQTLAAHQDEQTAVAEAAADGRQLA